jgi:Mg2+ and Co2+ transporter CorA
VDVLWVSEDGVARRRPDDLPSLIAADRGFVWVDIPAWDEEAARLLSETFGFHPLAIQGCAQRSHVPKVHAYPDHMFLVLHDAEPGQAGHVHLLELDQFVGRRYLVTVHGPLGEGVAVEAALRETGAVRDRMEAGRFLPSTPAELSHAIVSRIGRSLEARVWSLATKIAGLEREALTGKRKDPEKFLEQLFQVRHELLSIKTIAAQGREVFARMAALTRLMPAGDPSLIEDTIDQYERLRGLCEEEKEYLQGVLDFFQSRTTTKMNIAMERLALIAAVLLPVTAVASIYGMNIIVSEDTRLLHLGIVLVLIAAVCGVMLAWAKRHEWW